MAVAGPHRTVVKVCGLTRLEDARLALEAGADWLGFVLWDQSPRGIVAERAAEILQGVPGAYGVAVMVAPTPVEAERLARRCGAQRVQLHRVDSASWPASFPLPVTFAVTVNGAGELNGPAPPAEHLLMLDTAHPTLVGGTGSALPWSAVAAIAARRPVLLAGGLDGDNVAEAIERVRPFGVDASSRLESAPGIKDAARTRRFVQAVRTSDARLHASNP
jgi:phosphoribosylanthranilate isomerase